MESIMNAKERKTMENTRIAVLSIIVEDSESTASSMR